MLRSEKQEREREQETALLDYQIHTKQPSNPYQQLPESPTPPSLPYDSVKL